MSERSRKAWWPRAQVCGHQQPDVDEIVVTNTVPLPPEKRLPTIEVRSVAPLFAEATRRIHLGESVSSLFSSAETYG